jgi:diguanylate cyclase (GGDEF)-like protein/PAS domain S-box-containing protein
LILSAQWFGYLPDPQVARLIARQRLCETVAINASSHISAERWVDLKQSLRLIVDRDEDLMSIGVRSEFGTLRLDTGYHDEMWPAADEPILAVETVSIPLSFHKRPWGQIEFCYRRPHVTLVDQLANHPMIGLLGYFFIVGMFAYAFFVSRLMGVFNRTQVVPDRVRQALDTLAEGLLILNESGHIVLANKAFAGLVGIDSLKLSECNAADLAWVEDDVREEGYPWRLATEDGEVQTERMLRFTLDDGSQRIFSVNAAPLGKEGSQRGALATFRDVTHVEEHRVELERMLSLLRSSRDEIQRKNRALEILATQDSLTGCFNRRAFFEKFESLWGEAFFSGKPLACIMVDVDHFKSVNDTYGHHAGDEVLRAVSATIRELHESHGLVCRYGGEEFCVLLPEMSLQEALTQAEQTRLAIADIRLDDPEELRLTASLGVSELRFGAADPQGLVNQADACLYIAKREGRNRSIVYNASYSEVQETEKILSEVKHDRIDIPFQAVTALVSALSYRDADTAEHSRRVADLCSRAGEDLFDPAQRYILEVAGLLHDIGKIGVPDNILLKPGALTAEEWEIMSRHDRIGVEIIAGSFDCKLLSDIMANHHAFFGGRARDESLPTGKDIPLGARLLTIADSYDAMVSDRVYRKGRSHEEAVAELRRCAGTQFDPELVEHFIAKVSSTRAETAMGAFAVRKQHSLALGTEIQLMVQAAASKDLPSLQSRVSKLAKIANDFALEDICDAALRIERDANSEMFQWTSILQQTHNLLDLCRATQSQSLKTSLEHDQYQINEDSV